MPNSGAQLEVALEHHGLLDRSNAKEAQQLQAEITHLRESLEMATTKIRELQEMNQNARQKRHDPTLSSEPSTEEQHQQEMSELLADIERLQVEKDAVAQSKAEVESKLTSTLTDLRRLKEQFEQLQFTQASHDELQGAYERQFRHVAELRESVQEHQAILQRLRDRGINIHATPSPSICDDSELDSPMQRCETLFGELESAWANRGQVRPRSSVSCVTSMSTSTRSISDYYASFHKQETSAVPSNDDDSFSLESILARVSGVDQHQLDEALCFVNRIEEELKIYRENENMEDMSSSLNSLDMYPRSSLYPEVSTSTSLDSSADVDASQPKTILGRLRYLQRQCLQAVWRWCRFSIVLTVAVLINLWHGPESMLLEPQTLKPSPKSNPTQLVCVAQTVFLFPTSYPAYFTSFLANPWK